MNPSTLLLRELFLIWPELFCAESNFHRSTQIKAELIMQIGCRSNCRAENTSYSYTANFFAFWTEIFYKKSSPHISTKTRRGRNCHSPSKKFPLHISTKASPAKKWKNSFWKQKIPPPVINRQREERDEIKTHYISKPNGCRISTNMRSACAWIMGLNEELFTSYYVRKMREPSSSMLFGRGRKLFGLRPLSVFLPV